MKKVKEQIQKVLDECHVIYNEDGSGAVIDHVAKQRFKHNPDYMEVHDEHCKPCDNYMPSLSNTCLVCGSETKPLYFKIVHSGWQQGIDREEIQIHAGKHGNIFIFQDRDKLGFIINVYGQEDHHNSMNVWEEDLNNTENDFPMSEIEDFKNEWGQTHDEICSCLGYDKDDDGSSEMIMGDGYFWIEEDKKWYPKSSSMYNERQLTIADYLRNP